MKVHLGGSDPAVAAGQLMRAAEAAVRAAPTIAYTRAQKKIIRPRFATLAAATSALERKIRAGVDAMRGGFFTRLGIAREADDGNDTTDADLLKYLAAVDAMSPAAIERALRQAYQDLYDQGVEHVRAELDTSFDLQPTRALAALDRYALEFSDDVVSAEKASLKDLIREAFKDGLELPELARDIREHFAEGIHRIGPDGEERTVDLDAWSRMVARTETARAQNQGSLDGYAAAGVARVIWVTGNDERVCPICRPLDGTVAIVGENFPGTDVAAAPVHPNCRCSLVGYNAITAKLAKQAA